MIQAVRCGCLASSDSCGCGLKKAAGGGGGKSFHPRIQVDPGMPSHTHIHLAVAGHHLMLVLYGRLTFQPACVFRGLKIKD